MAKGKTPSTNFKLVNKSVKGYGLKSPWANDPKSAESTRQPSQPGSGDYYGVSVKNPIGRNRSSSLGNPVKPLKLKIPPKKLA